MIDFAIVRNLAWGLNPRERLTRLPNAYVCHPKVFAAISGQPLELHGFRKK